MRVNNAVEVYDATCQETSCSARRVGLCAQFMDADDRGSLGRDPGANALPAACAMAQFRACQWESVRTRTAQKRRLADPGGVHFYRPSGLAHRSGHARSDLLDAGIFLRSAASVGVEVQQCRRTTCYLPRDLA